MNKHTNIHYSLTAVSKEDTQKYLIKQEMRINKKLTRYRKTLVLLQLYVPLYTHIYIYTHIKKVVQRILERSGKVRLGRGQGKTAISHGMTYSISYWNGIYGVWCVSYNVHLHTATQLSTYTPALNTKLYIYIFAYQPTCYTLFVRTLYIPSHNTYNVPTHNTYTMYLHSTHNPKVTNNY